MEENKQYKVIAKITLLTLDGRENPIQDDYRPDHSLEDDSKILTMGVVNFIEKDRKEIKLGETAEVYITFILPERAKQKVFNLRRGNIWNIYEGNKRVAIGEFVTLC